MTTLTKKVGIASLIMMGSVLLSRVIGLIREMFIASFGGAGGAVDAYQVAFVIPEILNHIIASGFLSVTFIPIFSHYLARDREDEGWEVFSVILTTFGILLIAFILVSFMIAPALVELIAPGLKNASVKARAVRMTRIIIPAQFFFFAGGLLMAVQFAKERFAIPALAPLIYNVGIIGGGIILGPWLGMEGFSWGVLSGAFAGNFLVQFWGAKRAGMKFHVKFALGHPDLKKYVLLTLPLMVGLTMTFSTEIFMKFFGSYLPEGRIAALNYGLRVMLVLVGLFGQAAGVASFPFLANLIAQNKRKEMNHLLNDTLRRYISLVIPFSVLLMVLRHEIILLLFQRGQFDAAATEMTSGILVFLLVGAFAFAAQSVVVRGFYASQNTIFPAAFGTIAVIVSIPLYWYGMRTMGAKGVGLAISISAIFQATLLYMLWNRRSNNKGSRSVYLFFAKIIFLSIPIGIFLEWFRGNVLHAIDASTFTGCLVIAAITGALFMALFISAGYFLRIKEIFEGMNRLVEKVIRVFRR
ncbi:MAG: murein biosynthesis integral membrane protein MurJ [Deltaproteobacteria bacterium]|nr:murein biosynthesis integral membrane protein MurJ [Deltaproteobacteria bacterium]